MIQENMSVASHLNQANVAELGIENVVLEGQRKNKKILIINVRLGLVNVMIQVNMSVASHLYQANVAELRI